MLRHLAILISGLALAAPAAAVTIDFQSPDLPDNSTLFGGMLDYYDGGFTGAGDGPGPDLGATFNDAGPGVPFLLIDNPDGSNPLFAGGNQLLLAFGTAVGVMTVDPGFVGSISLRTGTDVVDNGTFFVFDGPDATGNVLASYFLGPGTPDSVISIPFPGVARSLQFPDIGFAGAFYDDITYTLVPEPTSAMLLAVGTAALASSRRTPRRVAKTPAASGEGVA